jgi:hypothetical protein
MHHLPTHGYLSFSSPLRSLPSLALQTGSGPHAFIFWCWGVTQEPRTWYLLGKRSTRQLVLSLCSSYSHV